MDPFIQYLEEAKKVADTIDSCNGTRQLHIIVGNESCDLDSMISTLALGYFHYRKSPPTAAIIPILNIPEDEFCLRTENYYLLKKLGIDQKLLVFRNNLNLTEIQKHGSLSISLVDHHVLRPEDHFLAPSVIEIFDHRPVDPNVVWDKNKINVRIEEVGSCSSLIAEKFLSVDSQILSNVLATLLYYVIIFDTIAFNPEAGRVKDLDIAVSKKLVNQFCLTEDVQAIFDELWTAHNDVSHLTAKQLLSKDLKVVEGMPVPGLPMLNEEYFQLPNVVEDMTQFCEQKCSSTMVLIGLHVLEREGLQQVHRDIAVFNCNSDTSLADAIVINLKNGSVLKGYDFCLQEVCVNLPNIRCFKQNNVKLTRKHILPLIKDTILQHKQTCNKK